MARVRYMNFTNGNFFAISTFAIIFLLIGRLTTFNFNNDINSPHLDKQDYEICIRREIGEKCQMSNYVINISSIFLYSPKLAWFHHKNEGNQNLF